MQRVRRSSTFWLFGLLLICSRVWPQTQGVKVHVRDTQRTTNASLFEGTTVFALASTADWLFIPLPSKHSPMDAFVYQQGCEVEKIQVSDDQVNVSRSLELSCVPARIIDLNIAIKNSEDLPPGELMTDFSYVGWRVRTTDNEEVREDIRFFHVGQFKISEGGRVQASAPDFANDPVLSRAVQLGILEITVEADHGRHVFGRLVVPGGMRAIQFTDLAERESTLNKMNRIGMSAREGLPVINGYQNPVWLQFLPGAK